MQFVKGVEYAFFAAASGNYVATYFVDVTPPVISGVAATPGLGNTAAISVDDRRTRGFPRGFRPVAVGADQHGGRRPAASRRTPSRSPGSSPSTTYYFRVTSTDGAGNAATTAVASFTMPATVFAATDTTVADFGGGHDSMAGHTSRRRRTAKSS